ncbi:hypothetical protein [Paraburkholderia sp. J12]|uniref:hypothetical protein n=1 Tax=Paraburkholderia sp. J12 TaxID=2805432 RepID=UPI002ABD5CDF|nr:hypothetical protein [Paraburkholderia sp. J12]
MKTRSSFEILLPLGIFVAACAISLPTCIVAVVWMTIGVCSLGYRNLNDFPTDGVSPMWRRGRWRACLLFYHLAWWPWYMRTELRDTITRTRHRLASQRTLRGRSAARRQERNVKKR